MHALRRPLARDPEAMPVTLFGGSEDVDSNTLRDYNGPLGAEIVPPLHSAIMRYQEPTRRHLL